MIKPRLGLINLVKKSISPFLSIPTSNTANFVLSGVLKILKGTPYLLLKEFFEKYVFSIFFKQKPVNSFTDVFPAEPVIAIVLIFVDFLKAELSLLNSLSGFS